MKKCALWKAEAGRLVGYGPGVSTWCYVAVDRPDQGDLMTGVLDRCRWGSPVLLYPNKPGGGPGRNGRLVRFPGRAGEQGYAIAGNGAGTRLRPANNTLFG